MNHCKRALLAVAMSWFLLLGMVFGQAAIPAALKSSAAIDPTGEKTIVAFVNENIGKLEDANPDAVRVAREALIQGSRDTNPLSPAYSLKYSEAVNKGIASLLDRSKEMRPRLNGAIVLARVAEGTLSTRLESTTLKLLDAKQPEPLRLWGMKASRWVLPELIKIGAHQKLMTQMMAVLKAQPTGSMTAEAYEALTAGGTDKKVAVIIAAPLMTIVKSRLEAYATDMPEDPASDVIPFRYLTQVGVWDGVVTPQQRVEAMQLLVNLMCFAALRGEDPAHHAAKEELGSVVNRCAQGIQVAALLQKQADLAGVAQQVVRMTQGGSSLKSSVELLVSEIVKVPEFKSITMPTAQPAAPKK